MGRDNQKVLIKGKTKGISNEAIDILSKPYPGINKPPDEGNE